MSHGKGLDAGEKNYPLLSSHVAGKRPQTTQVCSMGTSSKYHPVIKCDIAKSNIYRWLSHQNLHLVRGFSSHVGYRGYDYRFTMVDPPGIEGRSFDSFPPFCPFINISETMDGKFKHLGTQRKRPCFIGGFTRLKQVEARDFVDTWSPALLRDNCLGTRITETPKPKIIENHRINGGLMECYYRFNGMLLECYWNVTGMWMECINHPFVKSNVKKIELWPYFHGFSWGNRPTQWGIFQQTMVLTWPRWWRIQVWL